jgi:hypothetical protein
VACPQGGWLVAIFYLFGHPTPYAYGKGGSGSGIFLEKHKKRRSCRETTLQGIRIKGIVKMTKSQNHKITN